MMSKFVLGSQLFASKPVSLLVQARGLHATTRLLQIVSQCSSDDGTASFERSTWLEHLACEVEEFDDLLDALRETDLIEVVYDGSHRLTLRMTATCFDLVRPAPLSRSPEALVFTSAAQVARFLIDDLASPAQVVDAPDNRALFRLWCAHNVSHAELNQAITLGVAANDLTPHGLHRQLAHVRKQRLAAAGNPRA